MYQCIKEFWTFAYKIYNLEEPFERKIAKGSIWQRLVRDVGLGDYIVRLRSEDGLLAIDLTEEEFEEFFERMLTK